MSFASWPNGSSSSLATSHRAEKPVTTVIEERIDMATDTACASPPMKQAMTTGEKMTKKKSSSVWK